MMKKILLVLGILYGGSLWIGGMVYAPGAPTAQMSISSQFWLAVEGNELKRVKKLILKDKGLVFATKNGRTAYLLSVEKGNKKMAWLLADYFSHTNARCERGNALHIAVENRDFAMLKLVMKAAQLEDKDSLPKLINAPRLSAKSGQKKADMNTPLHIAALLCDRQIYNYLVSFGGNQKARNANFQSPQELLNKCPLTQANQQKAKTK